MNRTLAVDFDGTIVDHDYPDIGKPVPYAIEWIKCLQAHGVRVSLWTMRSGVELYEAVKYLADNGIVPWAVNTNPEQSEWTDSPKAYAQAYVDDSAVGCPLITNPRDGGRRMVDWEIVGPKLVWRFGIDVEHDTEDQ